MTEPLAGDRQQTTNQGSRPNGARLGGPGPEIPLRLACTQWNCRSLHNQAKVDYLNAITSDLICLQEVWQHEENISRVCGTTLSEVRRVLRRGGGTSVKARIPNIIVVRRLPINKDTEAIKVRIQSSYFLWIVNLYNHDGSLHRMQKLFGKVKEHIPSNEWQIILLIGDFNIDAQVSDDGYTLLRSLAKQFGLVASLPQQATRGASWIDYIFHGRAIKVISNQVLPSPSDHQAICWTFEISPIKPQRPLVIPSRKLAEDITERALRDETIVNTASFLRKVKCLRLEYRTLLQEVRPRARTQHDLINMLLQLDDPQRGLEVVNKYWRTLWELTEEQRYSSASRDAYQKLRKILKYHLYEKRDGAVVNVVLDDDGNLVDDSSILVRGSYVFSHTTFTYSHNQFLTNLY